MVIDIVGAEGAAGEALEQVILFVGSAIGADEANGVSAIDEANVAQLGGCGESSFLPGNGEELVAFTKQWLLDDWFPGAW